MHASDFAYGIALSRAFYICIKQARTQYQSSIICYRFILSGSCILFFINVNCSYGPHRKLILAASFLLKLHNCIYIKSTQNFPMCVGVYISDHLCKMAGTVIDRFSTQMRANA